MFDRIAIIGVGLIGGSLGLSLKGASAVKTIAGCGRESIQRAKKLGLIDEAHTHIAGAVTGAELVILCTPLSTYASLARQLAPYLAPGAILTDAGSVKGRPSQDILAGLSPEQRRFFVPGHPIAGTEKSGPEAAFAELFDGRNVILTPLPETDKAAAKRVAEIWKTAGAKVETMDAGAHDAMYAHVSHLVQLLCSSYGVMLMRQNAKLPQDETFRRFIRLCGSDPVMWRDIFSANRDAMLACLADFTARWEKLGKSDAAKVAEYVNKAKEKREKLEEPLRPRLRGRQDLLSESKMSLGNPEGVSKAAEVKRHPPLPPPQAVGEVPLLISATLVDSLEKKEYAHVVGGGFRGFTRNLLTENASADTQGMGDYSATLEEFRVAISADRVDTVEKLLKEGRAAYTSLRGA